MDSLGKRMRSNHGRAAVRMLGYVLVLDTPEAWHALSLILKARLTPDERAKLAATALWSLDDEGGLVVAEAFVERAGYPETPFMNVIGSAILWAEAASEAELDAYCLAAFNTMPLHRQRAFLDHVRAAA